MELTKMEEVPYAKPEENSLLGMTSLQEEDIGDTVCGIGNFKPLWIQKMANVNAFFVLFSILGIVEGAALSYVIGVLSTWEKRYSFDSKISGVILIADNISAAVISVLVGFYGRHLHRPRMIALGMMMVGLSCFLTSTPYFIYGPGIHLLNVDLEENVNGTNYQFCSASKPEEDCRDSTTTTAVVLFFVANFINGFGYNSYYTVGTTYLDDSVTRSTSPIYFGFQMSLRLLGPSLGYILASFCLQFYEDPSFDPNITSEDPRWVGAWWIGYVFLGCLLFIFSLPMMLFPRRLPHSIAPKKQKVRANSLSVPKLKDLPATFCKLIRNKIWLFHTLALVFHVNGIMGYYTLMPRYLEAHFRQTASEASFFSGATSIITMVAGIMIGGVVISKFRPRPRLLTGYMAVVALCAVVAMAVSMLIACPSISYVGEPTSEGNLNLTSSCNSRCGCTNRFFQPVCAIEEQKTFFSPCYAGCPDMFKSASNQTIFKDCSCMDEITESNHTDLVNGLCPFTCELFLIYILVLSISKMVGSTGHVGSMLVGIRCVTSEEKNLALGGLGVAMSAFAYTLYPLFYGALADSTCLVWEEKCGKTGNCWVYDVDKLRFRLHGASFVLLLIAMVFDGLVCYFSKDMVGDLYSELPQTDVNINQQDGHLNQHLE